MKCVSIEGVHFYNVSFHIATRSEHGKSQSYPNNLSHILFCLGYKDNHFLLHDQIFLLRKACEAKLFGGKEKVSYLCNRKPKLNKRMKKKVFAPFGVVIDIPAKVIKLIELLRDGIAVDTKRLTGKDMNQIGLCYWYGHIVPLDYEKAVKWYMASAEKRYCDAEHNLFICYMRGTGVAISIETALYWLKRAAKHHNAAAQCFLGEYYYEGKFVKRNRRYAEIWFTKSMTNALKNVDSVTLNDLGSKYYKREYGFPKDRNMAIKCFEKAAEEKLYLPIAWLITIYIDDNNREKVDYWMKEYYKCLKRNRGLSVMIKSKYEKFVESLEGRYHDEKT